MRPELETTADQNRERDFAEPVLNLSGRQEVERRQSNGCLSGLMQDHRIVDELFNEIEKSDDREVERREQLFARLRKKLEAHTLIEEDIFYPWIEKLLGLKDLVE